MKLRDALRIGLRSANTWQGELVVMDASGYDAIPNRQFHQPTTQGGLDYRNNLDRIVHL